jgi:NAD(P)H-dependent FMN reductase
MSEPALKVLCVVGTSTATSATHSVADRIAEGLLALGAEVDVFNPNEEPLALFNPESSHASREFLQLKARVEVADVYVLGTPDYHGSISSTLKNFLDHFWQEFAGKLFAEVVCSHEKGLTVIDQLRTVARQCYAWSLPYGLSFATIDLRDGAIVTEGLQRRIEMLVHDLWTYGLILRQQRCADLNGMFPGFLANVRQPKELGEPRAAHSR